MNKTSIEWTDFTWNPIRARLRGNHPLAGKHTMVHSGTFCTRISPGCKNCYASVINKRFGTGLDYEVPNLGAHEFFIDEKILAEPLKRKKPARIFVGDMFDLFHEAIPDEMLERVFRTMALNEDHTYQILTKRAERMCDWLSRLWRGKRPMSHIWAGVSVESPDYRWRIGELLRAPAAVRFLSIEPLLAPIPDLELGDKQCSHPSLEGIDRKDGSEKVWQCGVCNGCFVFDGIRQARSAIDWVIVGGESGPGARPFNLAWAESLLEQCGAAGVPFFMKQLGSAPVVHSCRDESCTHPDCGIVEIKLRDRKGGDMQEWPEILRLREFPKSGSVSA